jgi:hypothetical protein
MDDDWLDELLAERPLEVTLPATLERRIRLYIDRLNRRELAEGADNAYDVDSDSDLALIVLLLTEIALERDERHHALVADRLTGILTSREVAEEASRRQRPGVHHTGDPADG